MRSCPSASGTYAARIERLTPEEFTLLRKAVARHQPDLLPLVDEAVNVRMLTNREGNDLRDVVGLEISAELDDYSLKMDDLIDRIARMMEGM
jgi:hypothetical protein